MDMLLMSKGTGLKSDVHVPLAHVLVPISLKFPPLLTRSTALEVRDIHRDHSKHIEMAV